LPKSRRRPERKAAADATAAMEEASSVAVVEQPVVQARTRVQTQAAPEISERKRIAILACGDALAFLAFAAIGTGSHGTASGFAAIPLIVVVSLPFMASWYIVAPFLKVYRRDLMANPRKMAATTLIAWLLSWPVAMIFRGLFFDHGVPPFSFAIIALLANAVLLLVWRWPYALNNSMKQSSGG
jgi:hypothetical protein